MTERDSNGDGAVPVSGGAKNYYQSSQMDTEELASKMVFIQNKRFYLDVKENARGRFIKIAEVTPGGHKNRLTLSMAIAYEFRNVLGDFIEYYSTLGPSDPDTPPEDHRISLKTDRITRENKRYFLDLKENQRGRFLRVRQQQAYQYNVDGHPTIPPQIAIPAQGMVEFRDALTGLIDEYGQEAADQPELPPSHSVGNRRTKQFFLDVGQNHRGVFLRITEQTRNFRSAINIPENMWEELADYLKTTSEQMDDYYQQVGKEKPKSDYAHSPDGHEGEEELADERRRTDDSDDHENAVQQ